MAYKIMLADDSVTIQKVVELTFADSDYTVTAVSDGLTALNTVKEINPDIVLLDIFMPQLDGYQVCEKIKSDPLFKHIPVLLLTGTFESFDEEKANKVMADGYITKPFESSELISQVEELIKQTAGDEPVLEAPAEEVSTEEPLTAEPVLEADVVEAQEEKEELFDEPLFEAEEAEEIVTAEAEPAPSEGEPVFDTGDQAEISIDSDPEEEEIFSDSDDSLDLPKDSDDTDEDYLWEMADEEESAKGAEDGEEKEGDLWEEAFESTPDDAPEEAPIWEEGLDLTDEQSTPAEEQEPEAVFDVSAETESESKGSSEVEDIFGQEVSPKDEIGPQTDITFDDTDTTPEFDAALLDEEKTAKEQPPASVEPQDELLFEAEIGETPEPETVQGEVSAEGTDDEPALDEALSVPEVAEAQSEPLEDTDKVATEDILKQDSSDPDLVLEVPKADESEDEPLFEAELADYEEPATGQDQEAQAKETVIIQKKDVEPLQPETPAAEAAPREEEVLFTEPVKEPAELQPESVADVFEEDTPDSSVPSAEDTSPGKAAPPSTPGFASEDLEKVISEKIEGLLQSRLDTIIDRLVEQLNIKIGDTLAEKLVNKLDVEGLPEKAKKYLEEIAWEIVPDLAEIIIKKEIEGIKSQLS